MNKGCMYWLFIGFWLEPMIWVLKWIFLFLLDVVKVFFSMPIQYNRNKINDDYEFMYEDDFKQFCVELLKKNGYSNVKKVKRTGNHGADILADKNGEKYVFQCKSSIRKIDKSVVHEVYAGKEIYKCDVAVVIANNFFNKNAVQDAKLLNIELWDSDDIMKMQGIEQ